MSELTQLYQINGRPLSKTKIVHSCVVNGSNQSGWSDTITKGTGKLAKSKMNQAFPSYAEMLSRINAVKSETAVMVRRLLQKSDLI